MLCCIQYTFDDIYDKTPGDSDADPGLDATRWNEKNQNPHLFLPSKCSNATKTPWSSEDREDEQPTRIMLLKGQYTL